MLSAETSTTQEINQGECYTSFIEPFTNSCYTVNFLKESIVSVITLQGYSPSTLEVGISRDGSPSDLVDMIQDLFDHATGEYIPTVKCFIFAPHYGNNSSKNKHVLSSIKKHIYSPLKNEIEKDPNAKNVATVLFYIPKSLSEAGSHLPDLEIYVTSESVKCLLMNAVGQQVNHSLEFEEQEVVQAIL